MRMCSLFFQKSGCLDLQHLKKNLSKSSKVQCLQPQNNSPQNFGRQCLKGIFQFEPRSRTDCRLFGYAEERASVSGRKQMHALQHNQKVDNQSEIEVQTEISLSSIASRNSEDYYSAVANIALLRILRDSSLSAVSPNIHFSGRTKNTFSWGKNK